MIRLILRLFNIRDFDTCKSCETLKQQLEYERSEKQRLTDTLLNIIQPKVVEAAPIEVNQIAQSTAIFSRRRAILEAKDREDAQIKKSSTNLGRSDSLKRPEPVASEEIAKLEEELGVKDGTNV